MKKGGKSDYYPYFFQHSKMWLERLLISRQHLVLSTYPSKKLWVLIIFYSFSRHYTGSRLATVTVNLESIVTIGHTNVDIDKKWIHIGQNFCQLLYNVKCKIYIHVLVHSYLSMEGNGDMVLLTGVAQFTQSDCPVFFKTWTSESFSTFFKNFTSSHNQELLPGSSNQKVSG